MFFRSVLYDVISISGDSLAHPHCFSRGPPFIPEFCGWPYCLIHVLFGALVLAISLIQCFSVACGHLIVELFCLYCSSFNICLLSFFFSAFATGVNASIGHWRPVLKLVLRFMIMSKKNQQIIFQKMENIMKFRYF